MHLLLRRTQPCSRPSPTNTKLHACARLSFASHLYPDAALCPEPSPCPACFVACTHVLAALASLLAFSLRFPCLAKHLSNPCLAPDLLRPCSRRLYEMQTNEIPTSAPGDRASTSEEPAPIKMTNQQAELEQAAVCAANELNLCTNLPCAIDAKSVNFFSFSTRYRTLFIE